jgi:hypothetical protein
MSDVLPTEPRLTTVGKRRDELPREVEDASDRLVGPTRSTTI